jgi:hypothetical protein
MNKYFIEFTVIDFFLNPLLSSTLTLRSSSNFGFFHPFPRLRPHDLTLDRLMGDGHKTRRKAFDRRCCWRRMANENLTRLFIYLFII